MLSRSVWMIILTAAFLSGCAGGQPYVTPQRLQQGLVIVLPGIEGRSTLNREICRGLDEGGINYAIELRDWTAFYYGPLLNLRASDRNHRQAREIADYVRRYRAACPKAPVYLVGQSGGAAIAVWAAEALGPSEPVDGIILLAASLSPHYNLSGALRSSKKGIISFYSHRDWLLLGTNLVGTMDGEFASSAGRTGFEYPSATASPPSYRKLIQVGWNSDMASSGNTGGHLTSGATEYMAAYVAPFINTPVWTEAVKDAILKAEAGVVIRPNHASASPVPASMPAARATPAPTTRVAASPRPAPSPANPPPLSADPTPSPATPAPTKGPRVILPATPRPTPNIDKFD